MERKIGEICANAGNDADKNWFHGADIRGFASNLRNFLEGEDRRVYRSCAAYESPRGLLIVSCPPGASLAQRSVVPSISLASCVGLHHLKQATLLANHSGPAIAIGLRRHPEYFAGARSTPGHMGQSNGTSLPFCSRRTPRDAWGGGATGPRNLQMCPALPRARPR